MTLGAGTIRMYSSMLEDSPVRFTDSAERKRLLSGGEEKSFCKETALAESQGCCLWAFAIRLKDVGSRISTTTNFRFSIVEALSAQLEA